MSRRAEAARQAGVVALLANAAYRVGSEYLTYVKFRDAVRDAAHVQGARRRRAARSGSWSWRPSTTSRLHEDAVTIRREERHVMVEGAYTQADRGACPRYRLPLAVHLVDRRADVDRRWHDASVAALSRRSTGVSLQASAAAVLRCRLLGVPRAMEQDLVLALARFLLADELERVAQRLDGRLRSMSRRRGASASARRFRAGCLRAAPASSRAAAPSGPAPRG